ncbi:MAG: uracil-DNA glycosylase [Rhodocyclaceae bacterium]|nr:uracil-DNA glycosylase [Rhodocyclaceae bacterium]MBP7081634.1 uracil-DNA glycosylase [Rhodocyclaceae bacterium]
MTTATREQILREMGLGPVWKLRIPVTPDAVDSVSQPHSATNQVNGEVEIADRVRLAGPASAREAALPEVSAASLPTEWEPFARVVASCKQCALCERRKQAVVGVGDSHADWLFVGEGPGADEDEIGEPFVGQAGKLLDNMLAAIQLRRGTDVYIANAVKCRPPGNRTPSEDELMACRPYLLKQIEMIKPRLIVALGGSAAKTLLQQTDVKVGELRGQILDAQGIPLVVTYHPSYLLRSPMEKAKAWEDLCFMRRTMRSLKEQTSIRPDS